MKKTVMAWLLNCFLLCVPWIANGQTAIQRMGNADVQLFDEGWSFARYGLQPDGTRLDEPAGLEKKDLDDTQWRKQIIPYPPAEHPHSPATRRMYWLPRRYSYIQHLSSIQYFGKFLPKN